MAKAIRNVLFIMADQLRWDHLGCTGHPFLRTPNIDALAARGVRFSNAFANSGVCGPSRMSFYTGRYPISHGTTWNRVPLSIAEHTLGDYLDAADRSVHLAGKSHVLPDTPSLRRLGLSAQDARGFGKGGFIEIDRYDGHLPPGPESGYADFLRAQGYEGADPWSDFVISAADPTGAVRSGWQMRNARFPARVAEPHSETAYMTGKAIEFMQGKGDQPWMLHLSYVKPHWPYMAPAPYHRMYRASECLPAIRSDAELRDAHPALAAYRQHDEAIAFRSQECIDTVRPVYQGLIRQLDDHLGRLFEFMDRGDLLSSTLVLFASDHGDLLGDHWLGEKELFYDAVQRIPLIVSDPRIEADATRGGVDDRFVEAVDVLPTVLQALGLEIPGHRVEGRSLMPLIHAAGEAWRPFAYAELDYGFRKARQLLSVPPGSARAFSIRDRDWRYVHWLGLPEQLYDLRSDPDEMHDLGRESCYEAVRSSCREKLCDFLCRRKARVGVSDALVEEHAKSPRRASIPFGQW